MHALGPAYGHSAVDPGPPLNALTALAVVLVIGQKARLKVIKAGRRQVRDRLDPIVVKLDVLKHRVIARG